MYCLCWISFNYNSVLPFNSNLIQLSVGCGQFNSNPRCWIETELEFCTTLVDNVWVGGPGACEGWIKKKSKWDFEQSITFIWNVRPVFFSLHLFGYFLNIKGNKLSIAFSFLYLFFQGNDNATTSRSIWNSDSGSLSPSCSSLPPPPPRLQSLWPQRAFISCRIRICFLTNHWSSAYYQANDS